MLECPVQFVLLYSRIMEKLVLKTAVHSHNHEVSKDIYNSVYPDVRLAPLKGENLSDQIELEPKSKRFKLYLEKKYGTYLTLKDVSNIKAKHIADPDDITISLNNIVEKFTSIQGNIFEAVTNQKDELQYIFIQTKEGFELFTSMPSALMIDGTYKVNSLNMPLYIFMGSDSMGFGRIIAAGLVVCEKKDIVNSILEKFKQHNKASQNTELVVVDKDLNQMMCLKEAFPKSLVHLCLFHVLQAFLRKIVTFKMEKSDEELAKKMFRQMAFSTSQLEYEEIAEKFKSKFPQPVSEYFQENWNKISENWAGYSFKDIVCYGETTNNKLESKNAKLKNLINHTDSLSICIEKLIKFMKDDNENMKYNVNYQKLTIPKTGSEDSDLMTIFKLISTPRAVGIMKKNEKLAKSTKMIYNQLKESSFKVT